MTTPYSEGPRDAKICFVGEAPAGTEMKRGRPFVGPTGSLFNELLHRAGLVRAQCRIENVCKHPITSPSEVGDAEIEAFRQRIADCPANVFVPLGNLALRALTDEVGIRKWRGSILEGHNGRRVVPTIHPAATFLGRGPFTDQFLIVSDLRRVKEEAAHPAPLPAPILHIRPTWDQAREFIGCVFNLGEVCSFDIEVFNHQVSCISFSYDPQEAMSIPLIDSWRGMGAYWTEEEEFHLWGLIAELLGKPGLSKLAQNAAFDISFLYLQNRIRTRGTVLDPMILHRIMYPDMKSGLDALCSLYTRHPYYKDDKKIWTKMDADPDTFARYNARDAVVLPEIWETLWEDADDAFRAMYEETIALLDPTLFLTARGFPVDHDHLEKERTKISAQIAGLEKELGEIADWHFNPQSPAQCMKYFYETKGLKPYKAKRKRSDGKVEWTPTCDDKALARIVRRDKLPEARLAQEIRGLRKLLGTYLEIEFDEDGRLRCSYHLRGTTTTRLSSSKTIFERGMNMQNLDPRFRAFLVPDKEPPCD